MSATALVAILTVVAVSEAFIIGALVRDISTHGSIDQQPGTIAAVSNPLHAPAMAAFWAEEREIGATAAAVSNPLHAPAMAAFWAEERGVGGTTAAVSNPLHAPAMAAFWAEERGVGAPR